MVDVKNKPHLRVKKSQKRTVANCDAEAREGRNKQITVNGEALSNNHVPAAWYRRGTA